MSDGHCTDGTGRHLFEQVWATALWYINDSGDVEGVAETIHAVAEELEQLTGDEIDEIVNLDAADILANLRGPSCNVQPVADRDGGDR